MVGFGTAATVGQYGLGLSMLFAAIGNFRGENAGTIDGTANNLLDTDTLKWVLSFFMDEKDIEDSPILEALDGNEGFLNAILAPAFLFPGAKGKFFGAIAGGVAWLALSMYNADEDNQLKNIFNREPHQYSLTPEQLAELSIPKPTDAAFNEIAAIAADPTKATALNATEIAATRVIADADDAARVHDASARTKDALLARFRTGIDDMDKHATVAQDAEGGFEHTSDPGPDDPSLDLEDV